jgi:hypothetical protein
VLEPWLRGMLGRLERAQSETAPALAKAENSAADGAVAQASAGGPPAHWLEKVRRGVPHLLRPTPQPGSPVSVVEAQRTEMPPLSHSTPPPVSAVSTGARRPARESSVGEPAPQIADVPRAARRVETPVLRLLPPSGSKTAEDSAKGNSSLHILEQVAPVAAPRIQLKQLAPQAPAPEPAAIRHPPLTSERRDCWPALPPTPEPDPVEEVLAFWREQKRRRYLTEEQEGIYGPRRVSHRG